MTPKIADLLPEHFLLRLGQYVQTCARIEGLLWRIILTVREYDFDQKTEAHKAFKLRKNSQDLLKELRKEIHAMPDPIKKNLKDILDQIEAEHHARHMAVHGAWVLGENGCYRCEYYMKKGTKSDPEWHCYTSEITEKDIDFAVFTVDQICERAAKVWAGLLSEKNSAPNAGQGKG